MSDSMNMETSRCVQSGVDVSLIISAHIMSCLYISNLFYKNDNHNLYTILSLRLAIQLVHLTYFWAFWCSDSGEYRAFSSSNRGGLWCIVKIILQVTVIHFLQFSVSKQIPDTWKPCDDVLASCILGNTTMYLLYVPVPVLVPLHAWAWAWRNKFLMEKIWAYIACYAKYIVHCTRHTSHVTYIPCYTWVFNPWIFPNQSTFLFRMHDSTHLEVDNSGHTYAYACTFVYLCMSLYHKMCWCQQTTLRMMTI